MYYNLTCDHSNDSTEHYFPVALFIMLHMMASVCLSLYMCDYSSETECVLCIMLHVLCCMHMMVLPLALRIKS